MKKFNMNALKHLVGDWNLEFGSRYHGKKLRQTIKDFCNNQQFKLLEGAALAKALFQNVQGFSSGYAISDDLEKLLVRAGVLPVVELEKQYYANNVYTLKMSGGSPKPIAQLEMWQKIEEAMHGKQELPQRPLNLKKESIRLCAMVNSDKYDQSEFMANVKSWLYQYIKSNADSYKRKLAFGALHALVKGGEFNVEAFYHCCLIRDSFTQRDDETQRKIAVPKNKLGMIAIALAKALDPNNFTSHLKNNYQVYVPNKAEKARYIALYIRRSELSLPVVSGVRVSDAVNAAHIDIAGLPVAKPAVVAQTEPTKSAKGSSLFAKLVAQMDEAVDRVNALPAVPFAKVVTEESVDADDKKIAAKTALMCS